MKKIKFIIIILVLVPLISSSAQTIVIGNGASIVVQLGADLCAGEVGNIFGDLSGEGTECGLPVPVEIEVETIPTEFALYQNYPNPFNPSTLIKYQVPEKSFVSIRVYDLLGKELVTLVNEEKPAGSYDVNFDAGQLSSGFYIYTIKAGNFASSKKMVLMK
ncbi:MAG: T9SS type A sorting domain-containing protein [Bacteroidetes bacterium]|nr:T9SS type A sorting domain-containing protein [Bacteroidota bacterium]